jgi:Lon protease-like protein
VTGFHPAVRDLPDAFPVFPLTGALLLPHGRLPLNIFEPRYLAMVEDALGAGRMLGMIQPDPVQPAGANGPGLYRIGCLGRLSSFSETEDGRLLITLHGVIRFRVMEELPLRRGYRRVRADYVDFVGDLEAAEAAPMPVARETLLDALRQYFDHHGIEANWEAISTMPDDPLVITLGMVCPFAPEEKQALLEAQAADRATVLLALLQIGTHPPPPGSTGRTAS